MKFPFTHYIERGEAEFELTGTYEATPSVPATHMQPAEGGEVEIVTVLWNGVPVSLTDNEEAALIVILQEQSGEDFADREADAEEYRFERYREEKMGAA